MGSGWFNLVLTLCAVRGLGRTMGYEKGKLSGEGLPEGDRLFYRSYAVIGAAYCGSGGPYWAYMSLFRLREENLLPTTNRAGEMFFIG